MAEVNLVAQSGEKSGTVELSDHVFGVRPHVGAMHQAVRVYLGNQRQGTASTKGRSEVNASGRKPWRQKGTGRARSGTRSSPIWRGGGVVFGPQPHFRHRELPRRLRRLAIRSALSARAGDGNVVVLDGLELPAVKTRQMVEVLRNLESADRKTLLVLPAYEEAIYRAAGNLPRVRVRVARELTTYDVLDSQRVVLLKEALPILEEMYR
jgi:large subunit ribosomal protein L4